MVKSTLRDILSKLSGKEWRWIYRIEHDSEISTGRVAVKYNKNYISITWDEGKLKAIHGNYPPLSFSDREVVDFKNGQIIITVNGWKINLDIK